MLAQNLHYHHWWRTALSRFTWISTSHQGWSVHWIAAVRIIWNGIHRCDDFPSRKTESRHDATMEPRYQRPLDRRRLDIDPTRKCRIDVSSTSIRWSLLSAWGVVLQSNSTRHDDSQLSINHWKIFSRGCQIREVHARVFCYIMD